MWSAKSKVLPTPAIDYLTCNGVNPDFFAHTCGVSKLTCVQHFNNGRHNFDNEVTLYYEKLANTRFKELQIYQNKSENMIEI